MTAEFKSEIEKFFIDGGTRIDLIAQVMELDNNIGTYNYDIVNLKETEKQIKAVNKAKGKNSLLQENYVVAREYKLLLIMVDPGFLLFADVVRAFISLVTINATVVNFHRILMTIHMSALKHMFDELHGYVSGKETRFNP